MRLFNIVCSIKYIRVVFACLLCCAVTLAAHARSPVVLISFDGFAQRYIAQYQPKNILALMQRGIYAKALIPVYPSKTFPNHMSIATGSYSAKHGIIHNDFYRRDLRRQYYKGAAEDDASWLSAKPIWTLAQQHGLKSALYFWPEAKVQYQGVSPSYVVSYNKHTSNEARIAQIINWLNLPEDKRPDFIAGYFSLLDAAGHVFGPDSKELEQAVQQADVLVGKLVDALQHKVQVPVDLLLVSDHGMAPVDREHTIDWRDLLPGDNKILAINGQTQILLYCAQQCNAASQRLNKISDPRFSVYQKPHFPAHWHWQNNDKLLPDLVLDAQMPYIFSDPGMFSALGVFINRGTHGYDPLNNDAMQGIFIATGPDFQRNVEFPAFENIHIFPLLAKLLGLPEPANIDGDGKVLTPYLAAER